MHIVYAIARLLPYWAIALGLASAEIAISLKRKNFAPGLRKFCWANFFVMFLLTGLWVVGRGDLNSDRWVRFMIDSFRHTGLMHQ